MTGVFLKLLNMSIAAGWLILAVIALRLVFKKAPKWVNPLLWGIVALRLVMPFSLESVLSLIPSAETVTAQTVVPGAAAGTPVRPVINSGVQFIDNAVNPVITQNYAAAPAAGADPVQIAAQAAAVVWVIGLALMLAWALASWMGLRNRVSTAVRMSDGVYGSEFVSSPFVLGVVRPKIYLPYGLAAEEAEYVIAHERAHIARRDTWIKPLGYILLCVYWFNPLVWAAYILLCRDIEYACDERVAAKLTDAQRADYSQALLACCVRRSRIAACPLAFGEGSVKGRIKGVLSYKKPAFWVIAVALAAAAILAVCFLTDPVSEDGDGVISNVPEGTPESVELAAREYVSGVAESLREGGTNIVSVELNGLTRREAGEVSGANGYELVLYAVDYRIHSEPEGGTSEFWFGDTPYLLFGERGGEYTLLGETRQSYIDAFSGTGSNAYAAAAASLYELYSSRSYYASAAFTPPDGLTAAGYDASLGWCGGWVLTGSGGEKCGAVLTFDASCADIRDGSMLTPGELWLVSGPQESGSGAYDGLGCPAYIYLSSYDRGDLAMRIAAGASGGAADWLPAGESRFWTLFLSRDGDGVGYCLALDAELFTREDAIDFAATFLFPDEAYYASAGFEVPDALTAGAFERYIGAAGGWILTPMAYEVLDTGTNYGWEYRAASGSVLTFNARNEARWDGDKLTGVVPSGVGAAWTDEEVLTNLNYPAVIMRRVFDLYTAADLEILAGQGVDITRLLRQSEYWCVYMARPGEDVGYVLSLDAGRYTREDAIAFAESFRFPETHGFSASGVSVSAYTGDGFPAAVLVEAKNYVANQAELLSVNGSEGAYGETFSVTGAEITGIYVVNGGAGGTLPGGESYSLDFFAVAWRLGVDYAGAMSIPGYGPDGWQEGAYEIYGGYLTPTDPTRLLFRRSSLGDTLIGVTTEGEIERLYNEGGYTDRYGGAARQLYSNWLSALSAGYTWYDVEWDSGVAWPSEAVRRQVCADAAKRANAVFAAGEGAYSVTGVRVLSLAGHDPGVSSADEGQLMFYEYAYSLTLENPLGTIPDGYSVLGNEYVPESNPCLLFVGDADDCEALAATDTYAIEHLWTAQVYRDMYGENPWAAAAGELFASRSTTGGVIAPGDVGIPDQFSAPQYVCEAVQQYVAGEANKISSGEEPVVFARVESDAERIETGASVTEDGVTYSLELYRFDYWLSTSSTLSAHETRTALLLFKSAQGESEYVGGLDEEQFSGAGAEETARAMYSILRREAEGVRINDPNIALVDPYAVDCACSLAARYADEAGAGGAEISEMYAAREPMRLTGPTGIEYAVGFYRVDYGLDIGGDLKRDTALLIVFTGEKDAFSEAVSYVEFESTFRGDFTGAASDALYRHMSEAAADMTMSSEIRSSGGGVKSGFTDAQISELYERVRDNYSYGGAQTYEVAFVYSGSDSARYDFEEVYTVTEGDPDFAYVDTLFNS